VNGELGRAAILHALGEHLEITGLALVIAILVGIPLGIHIAREKFLAAPVLAIVSALQTIPSLALLGFLIPILGIGARPAIVALFVYALLPIVANTHAALGRVDPAAIDAARGMGMRDMQILRDVTLPQALPVIMAGVRTATVFSVGVATLAALVGGGGLGTFIFRGIAMVNTRMVLAGAIPTALLALALDALLAIVGRALTPRGLRDERASS
jgi:osmoprotectant transport system permease protein